MADDGNVTVSNGRISFSRTFDFEGVASGTDARSSTAFNLSKGRDEPDQDYYFSVIYRDGREQKLQPFVMADNFLSSLNGRKGQRNLKINLR